MHSEAGGGDNELNLNEGGRYRFDLTNGFTRWGKIEKIVWDDDGYPFVIHIRAFNHKTDKDELNYTLSWSSIAGYALADDAPFEYGDQKPPSRPRR